MAEPEKQWAFEGALALVSRDEDAAKQARRPLTTTLGALFVLGRAVAGVGWIAGFLLVLPELSREAGLEPDEELLVAIVVSAAAAVGVVVLLVLAWLIWRGSNAARMLVMFGLTLSITSSAIGYFSMGEEITVRTTLVVLALDILVLLALSSRDARAWSRGRARRRARS